MSGNVGLLAQRDQAQATIAAWLDDAHGSADTKRVAAKMLDHFTQVVLSFTDVDPAALLLTVVELNQLIADGLRESARKDEDDGRIP